MDNCERAALARGGIPVSCGCQFDRACVFHRVSVDKVSHSSRHRPMPYTAIISSRAFESVSLRAQEDPEDTISMTWVVEKPFRPTLGVLLSIPTQRCAKHWVRARNIAKYQGRNTSNWFTRGDTELSKPKRETSIQANFLMHSIIPGKILEITVIPRPTRANRLVT